MGVHILQNKEEEIATLYCSTTEWSFGPVFHEQKPYISAYDYAQKFLDWLPQDARTYTERELGNKYSEFQNLEWHQCLNLCDRLITKDETFCQECIEESISDGTSYCQECKFMTETLVYHICERCHKTKS